MAFLDKVTQIANQAAEKAGDAVETGKIALKIKEEEGEIKDNELKIGQEIVKRLDNGEEFDGDIAALYEKIVASRKRIEELNAQKPN